MPRTATWIVAAVLLAASGCGSSGGSHGSTGASGSSGHSAATGTAGRLTPVTTPRYGQPPASASVRSGLVQVAYRDITISPDLIKVKVGTTVRWTDYDPIEHNVTSESGPQSFKSKNLHQGQTFQVTLTHPGTIHYLCTIHPATMNGTIEVVG